MSADLNLPQTGQGLVDRALSAVAAALRALRADTLAERPQVTETLTTTEKKVFHGLGAPPKGYLVVGRSANAVVYDGATVSSDPARFIYLRASATVTVDLVFF